MADSFPVIPGAMLLPAFVPGKVSQGKLVLGERGEQRVMCINLMKQQSKHQFNLLMTGSRWPHRGAGPGEELVGELLEARP